MLGIINHQGNANTNYFTLTSVISLIKRQIITSLGEDVKKLGPPHAGENVKQCSCFGNQPGTFSRVNTELPYEPAISLLGIYPPK